MLWLLFFAKSTCETRMITSPLYFKLWRTQCDNSVVTLAANPCCWKLWVIKCHAAIGSDQFI